SLQAAAELAKITYKRDQDLIKMKAISQATLDSATADLKSKQAQVVSQMALVAKKTICAPFDGRLGINLVNPGQYINPGDKISTLQTLDPIYVDFYIPQQSLMEVAPDQNVTLTTDTFPDKVFK